MNNDHYQYIEAINTLWLLLLWLLLHRGYYSCGYCAMTIITVAIMACFGNILINLNIL